LATGVPLCQVETLSLVLGAQKMNEAIKSAAFRNKKFNTSWDRRFRRCLGKEKGSALVEFALVLPVFLLITTGIFSFGITLNNYLELNNAVNLAAQQLAISPNVIADPCNTATSAIHTAAPYLNQSNITVTTTITSGSTTQATTSFSGSSCPAGAALLTNGDPVEVAAQYPCTLAGFGFNISCTLEAQVSEMAQ
jgi:Flp pilus assembly protein TadG